MVHKCISVSEEFEKLARENDISWSEAARVGMSMILTDEGKVEYNNRLNLIRKKKLESVKNAANEAIDHE